MPGIVLAFLSGGASVVARDQDLDPLLALPFGVGVALTLDESALLLELDDGQLVPLPFVVEVGDAIEIDPPEGLFDPDAP